MFSLRKVFRDMMANMEAAKLRKQQFPVMIREIESGNLPEVERIFAAVEFFGPQRRAIVKAAIARDDVALMDAFIAGSSAGIAR